MLVYFVSYCCLKKKDVMHSNRKFKWNFETILDVEVDGEQDMKIKLE